MEEQETSMLDDILSSEMEYYDGLPEGASNRSDELKVLCQLIDRDIEIKKINSQAWAAQDKLAIEKELQEAKLAQERELMELKMKADKELQIMKMESERKFEEFKFNAEHEIAYKKQLNDEIMQSKDLALREQQLKSEKIRGYLEAGCKILCIAAFVGFEVMAHNRDMEDVIATASTHVSKNPMKLKF